MKYIILFSFTFFISTIAFAQEYGWTDISANLPQLGNFNDVHVIGEEVWISGGNDAVFYSPDGGTTFQTQELPPQAGNFGISSSVFMKNNKEGYVVTYSGEINKTEDGGKNWYALHDPGGGLNSVHFPPNSDTGYACGSNGTVWMFDNKSITDISPPDNASNLQSICFPADNNDGKICGETTIARRKNNTWNNLQFYDSTLGYYSLFFVNDSTGWCVGINGTIILTVDGISWVGQLSNTTKTLNDVYFSNSLEGWIAGSEVLLHTTDGGKTWTEELESFTPGKILTGVYFTSANNGYVVGNYTVLKYGELTSTGNTIVKTLQFSVFPNPAKSKFKVQSSNFKVEDATIELYDLTGKKLLEKQISAGTENIEIDVSYLKSGVYFCRLVSEKYSATKKLIIQK